MSSSPCIVIGAGGHGVVTLNVLLLNGRNVIGIVDRNPALHGAEVLGVRVIGDDSKILDYPPDEIHLANGVGSTSSLANRRAVYERMTELGYRFCTEAHPGSVIGQGVELGEGAQIMAGAMVQPRCRISRNTIVNTAASIDHDTVIGSHSHVAPGVTVSGGVTIGDDVHVGAGATIIQNVYIGDGAVIGAGAVIISDVDSNALMVGVPARRIR